MVALNPTTRGSSTSVTNPYSFRPAHVWRKVRTFVLLAVLAWLGYLSYRLLFTPVHPYAVIDGLTVYVNPDDQAITAAAIQAGYFEPLLTKVLLENLRVGDTVIDIGANIGYYSVLAAKKVGPSGRVIAFEPDPQAFSFLKRNVEVNRFTNIVAEQKAVSNVPGILKLYIARQNLGDHRIFPAEEARQEIEVSAVALDDYLSDAAPLHFIKIDTQGAEGLIFEGMQGTLRRHPNVRVAVEFWPYGLERAGSSGAQLLNQIQTLGFRMEELNEAEGEVRAVTAPELLKKYTRESKAHTNLLLTRAGVIR